MSKRAGDEQLEISRSFLTTAELEKIHTIHRQQLREELARSLEEHISNARDQVAAEARERLNDSFRRTAAHFTQIERQLVLALNRVLTGKYEGILGDLRDRNTHLYQIVQSLCEHIAVATRRTSHSEDKELVSEVLLAIIVLVIPATYTFFPDALTTTALKFIVPTFYLVMAVGLLYWRHAFSKLRKSEAAALGTLADQKEKAADVLLASVETNI